MKKCPNCGALMKSNVNFCTKCGADLRQIDNSPQEAIAKSEDSHQIKSQPNSGENFKQNQAKPNAANNEQAQENQFQQAPTSANTQEANSERPNNVIQNYWQWCVDSWQHPFSALIGESWYGWATILLDDLLIILGFYFCLKSMANGYGVGRIVSGFAFSGVISLLLFTLLFEAIIIGGYYAGHYFIYGKTDGLIAFVNRGVHASNLNLILSILVFVILVMGPNNGSFVSVVLFIIFSLFYMGFQVTALGENRQPIRDKMYGYIISYLIILVAIAILFSILYNSMYQSILNQIFSTLN